MAFFGYLSDVITKLKFNYDYILYVECGFAIIYILIALIGFFSAKLRYYNKSLFYYTENSYSIIAIAFLFFVYSKADDLYVLEILSCYLTIRFICSLLKIVHHIQSMWKFKLKKADKELIDGFIDMSEENSHSFVTDYDGFYDTPVRRAEYLQTGNISKGENDYKMNFSRIKTYIGKARTLNLSDEETDEIDKLEMDIDKYSKRKISPMERKIFSDRLLGLIKIISKYQAM